MSTYSRGALTLVATVAATFHVPEKEVEPVATEAVVHAAAPDVSQAAAPDASKAAAAVVQAAAPVGQAAAPVGQAAAPDASHAAAPDASKAAAANESMARNIGGLRRPPQDLDRVYANIGAGRRVDWSGYHVITSHMHIDRFEVLLTAVRKRRWEDFWSHYFSSGSLRFDLSRRIQAQTGVRIDAQQLVPGTGVWWLTMFAGYGIVDVVADQIPDEVAHAVQDDSICFLCHVPGGREKPFVMEFKCSLQ